MKKFRLLLWVSITLIVLPLKAQEDVLLTIGKDPVYASEFVRLLKKNLGSLESKPNIQESLELFINFKLKVKEAEALGIDTARQFITELESYRSHLAKPFLLDQEVTDELVKEAYERSLWEVRASHILLAVAMDAPPADTLIAFQKAMELREKILLGADFGQVAMESSDDPTAKTNQGDLGYFTALRMVYPFENGVYNTPLGGISEPVRTQFGYHVLKVTDKRPSQGKVRVAQIWKAFNITMSDEEKAAVKDHADSLYNELLKGADFAVLAAKHSDDRTTGPKGGILPTFGFGEMYPEFEEAAFSLKNPGDIGKPVLTNMGYHVLKLIERQPPPTFEQAKSGIVRKINQDDRSLKSKQVVVNRLKKEYHFTVNQKALEEFYRMVDPSIFEARWNANPALQKKGVLFTLNNQEYTQADFAGFLALNMKESAIRTIAEYVDARFNDFVNVKVMEYEETQLSKKYPEFRDLLQEFHDGNLIFELSDKMVWSKASRDTIGLKEFFKANESNYRFGERVEATIIHLKSKTDIDKAVKAARTAVEAACKKECTPETIQEALSLAVKQFPGAGFEIKSGKYSKGDNWYVDQVKWKSGLASSITEEGSAVLVMVHQLLKPGSKSLSDIRGQVTADYQDFLEKEWIRQLREKYPVKVNENALAKIKI